MSIITDILKEIPLSTVLRERLQELEKKYNELEAENTKLESRLDELTKTSELVEGQKRILVLLSSCGEALTAETVARSLCLSPTRTQYYLGRMYDQYVGRVGHPGASFLHEGGTAYLVENDLVE